MIDPYNLNTDKFQNQKEFEDYMQFINAHAGTSMLSKTKKEFVGKFPGLAFPFPSGSDKTSVFDLPPERRIKNPLLRRLKRKKEAHEQGKLANYSRMHSKHSQS